MSESNKKMEKTYVIILIILLGGVAQYNISDGDRISPQTEYRGVCILSSKEILKNLLIIINLKHA